MDIGTKFLTHQTAYFLGLLMANEQTNINDKIYWQAPIRHNPKYYNYVDLETHYNYLKEISIFLNNKDTHMVDFYRRKDIPIQKYNAGKNGIITLFRENRVNYSNRDLINDIFEPLISSANVIQHAFLIGVFDGRSSFDKTANFIVLDYDNDELKDLIDLLLINLNIKPNINSKKSARARKVSSNPRKKQIRIKHLEFLEKIGYISPTRFNNSTRTLPNDFEKISVPSILPGLKLIKEK